MRSTTASKIVRAKINKLSLVGVRPLSFLQASHSLGFTDVTYLQTLYVVSLSCAMYYAIKCNFAITEASTIVTTITSHASHNCNVNTTKTFEPVKNL